MVGLLGERSSVCQCVGSQSRKLMIREPPWKQNGLPPVVNIRQTASAKSQSVRGAFHQTAFMSSCLTISHTFYLSCLSSILGVLVFYGLL